MQNEIPVEIREERRKLIPLPPGRGGSSQLTMGEEWKTIICSPVNHCMIRRIFGGCPSLSIQHLLGAAVYGHLRNTTGTTGLCHCSFPGTPRELPEAAATPACSSQGQLLALKCVWRPFGRSSIGSHLLAPWPQVYVPVPPE
jgi:hypothetical protein